MSSQEIQEVGQRWADAERGGDPGVLDELAVADFTLVGPLGFLLDKQQWVNRFTGERALRIESLDWQQQSVREYGDAAVVIGSYTQRAEFNGNPVNGEFRVTQMLVRHNGTWRLASIHLSPIGAPPEFAQRKGADR